MTADLRAPVLGAVAWGSAVLAFLAPWWMVLALAAGLVAVGGGMRGRRLLAAHHVAWWASGLAVAASVWLHVGAVATSPVTALARHRASVEVVLVVRSDPVLRDGAHSSYVLFRAEVLSVTGRGTRHRVRAPVLVIAGAGWARLHLGARVAAGGHLDRAEGRDLAALLATRGPPRVLHGPGRAYRVADGVRAGIRRAVAGQPTGPRGLVPALVDGDAAGLPTETTDDFRTAGLTHLLAVSGTNLTLAVGFLLVVARWLRVRARGLMVVGALGIAGFVLLARAEPSVLRAAAMGAVALAGMGSGGRERGTRALGAAVFVVVLLDPWLAVSAGFALSALATAGILLFAPPWRDALARWLPRWAAEAIAVPMAAQLACTPLVAAISGQVSLVAVGANLLAEPAVGPATVLGLVGGLAATVSGPLGRLVALPAGWCARWIIAVARHAAALPMAGTSWPTSAVGLVMLSGICMVALLTLAPLLAQRTPTVAVAFLLTVFLFVPVPSFGWPPDGWVLVACDVGQGDGLVLNAGAGSAVVVDAGPYPAFMDSCLRRLGVRRVPLIVLTHFHADHVDGLPGVLLHRRVGEIEVSPYAVSAAGARLVRTDATVDRVPEVSAVVGQTRRVGQLTLQVLAPSEPPPSDSDSPPNDASIVLLVEVRGIRILMMGDEETPSQQHLAALYPGLRADVLKVAHHGSAKQDPALVTSLGAKLAVISVGTDNGYGHPARQALDLVRSAGMTLGRTDRDGDVAVIVGADGAPALRHRLPPKAPPSGNVGQ